MVTESEFRVCLVCGKQLGYVNKRRFVHRKCIAELFRLHDCDMKWESDKTKTRRKEAEHIYALHFGAVSKELPAPRRRVLEKVIKSLTYRERQIIRLLYFNNFTYEGLGRKFNVTRERIRSIHYHALDKLRCRMTQLSICDFHDATTV